MLPWFFLSVSEPKDSLKTKTILCWNLDKDKNRDIVIIKNSYLDFPKEFPSPLFSLNKFEL